MATAKNTSKAADSEKDVVAAGEDKSKTTQTTKQAEEKDVATSAEKREATPEEVKAGAEDGNVGAVVDGESNAFEDDAEFSEDDFNEDATIEGSSGTVTEKNLDGDEFEVPYVYLTAADLEPVRTSDSDDPAKSWTAQEYAEERTDEDGNTKDPVALVPVEATPGQVFRVGELPNRAVAEAAGINYDQFVAGLPVRPDIANEAPRKGIPA